MSDSSIMKDRLRICIVTFMFPPLVGGVEAQAEKHARQLLALSHDVTVITLRHYSHWKRFEVIDGLPVIRVGNFYRRSGRLNIGRAGHPPIELAVLLTLWRLRHTYDVIHVMQLSGLGAVAAFIGKLTHKPVIISIQSAGPDERQRKRIAEQGPRLMADTLSNADFLTVGKKDWVGGDIEDLPQRTFGGHMMLRFLRNSDAYYQALSTRVSDSLVAHGFRREHIVRIPNSVDTQKFRPPATRPDPARAERDIVSVARLEFPKGVDVLLHAWARMLREPTAWRTHLKPRLRLVGDGKFTPQMKRIATELGILESVEFMGERDDVVNLLQQAWGFVLPSRWEGMPNALLEAIACGLPCLATQVSGSEDIIQPGVNGLLVEPEDPAAMARALRLLIEDTQLAQRLGQAARETALLDYQISTVTERCVQVYYRLLSQEAQALPVTLEETGKL
jgi:glycosyltransferase involved in cell wall biosynthesis